MSSVLSQKAIHLVMGVILSVVVIGVTTAEASQRNQGKRCVTVQDRRANPGFCRNFRPDNRFYRAGPNNGGRVVLEFGNNRVRGDFRRNNYRRNDFRRNDFRRNDFRNRNFRNNNVRRRGRGRQIVFRDVIPARGRSNIVVTEEIVRTRRGGRRRVCTVSARGRDADLIRTRRLRNVAARRCSRRASVRIR
ncbi:MAG: hypothetical protein AAF742_05600 [Pseudomonadota bacterium]